MSRKHSAMLVRAAGVLADLFIRLVGLVLKFGGKEEDVHHVITKDGQYMLEWFAKMIATAFKFTWIGRITVDYAKVNREGLMEAAKATLGALTEDDLDDYKIQDGDTGKYTFELHIFTVPTVMRDLEVVTMLISHGYSPARIEHGLTLAIETPDFVKKQGRDIWLPGHTEMFVPQADGLLCRYVPCLHWEEPTGEPGKDEGLLFDHDVFEEFEPGDLILCYREIET
jgi:hypothetical protein